MPTFEGSCHCGNLRIAFRTESPPDDLAVRACQCSFCRAHGARTVSDPHGWVTVVVADESRTTRYRFGLATADFLICRTCGVYVGAVMEHQGRCYCALNVNALEGEAFQGRAARPVDYEGESAESRIERRTRVWTPCSIEKR